MAPLFSAANTAANFFEPGGASRSVSEVNFGRPSSSSLARFQQQMNTNNNTAAVTSASSTTPSPTHSSSSPISAVQNQDNMKNNNQKSSQGNDFVVVESSSEVQQQKPEEENPMKEEEQQQHQDAKQNHQDPVVEKEKEEEKEQAPKTKKEQQKEEGKEEVKKEQQQQQQQQQEQEEKSNNKKPQSTNEQKAEEKDEEFPEERFLSFDLREALVKSLPLLTLIYKVNAKAEILKVNAVAFKHAVKINANLISGEVKFDLNSDIIHEHCALRIQELLSSGEPQLAVDIAGQFARFYPKSASARYNYAICLVKAQQLEDALAELQKAISLGVDSKQAHDDEDFSPLSNQIKFRMLGASEMETVKFGPLMELFPAMKLAVARKLMDKHRGSLDAAASDYITNPSVYNAEPAQMNSNNNSSNNSNNNNNNAWNQFNPNANQFSGLQKNNNNNNNNNNQW